MTDRNLTHLYFLLDRSGSMQSVRDDTVGGFPEPNVLRFSLCVLQLPGQVAGMPAGVQGEARGQRPAGEVQQDRQVISPGVVARPGHRKINRPRAPGRPRGRGRQRRRCRAAP